MLVDTVVLVELVLLLGEGIGFGGRRRLLLAGACSDARRAGASPRGGSIGIGWRW
jgi:hypothetical protein